MTDEADSRARDTDGSDGYVHDPAAFEGSRGRPAGGHGERVDGRSERRSREQGDVEPSERSDPRATPAGRDTDREFGWRGWVLVGFLLVAFVVVPVALYYVPRAQGVVTSLGLSLRDAYLVLPLLPALLLGALAVWATTRP